MLGFWVVGPVKCGGQMSTTVKQVSGSSCSTFPGVGLHFTQTVSKRFSV